MAALLLRLMHAVFRIMTNLNCVCMCVYVHACVCVRVCVCVCVVSWVGTDGQVSYLGLILGRVKLYSHQDIRFRFAIMAAQWFVVILWYRET